MIGGVVFPQGTPAGFPPFTSALAPPINKEHLDGLRLV